MAGTGNDDLQRHRRTYAAVVGVALVAGIAFALHAPDRGGSAGVSVAAQATPTSGVVYDQFTTTTVAPTTTVRTPTTTKAARASATTTTTAAGKAPATTTVAPTTTTVDPGSLPQTDVKPSTSGATFDAGVQALWQSIVRDDPSIGQAFFFPRAAYLQVKAISDPSGDYQNRLLANFADDVHALHAKLGANASRAQLVGASVPDQAVWVVPGQEYNQLPYWRVYGSTLRCTLDGAEQSFPITSLISWRGEWYVVHLGAIR